MKAVRYSVDDLSGDELCLLDDRSLFSSTSFASLWSSVGGFPVMYLVEDAQELVAALPAVEFGKSFYRRVQLMPDGCYARLRLRTDSKIDRNEVIGCLIDALTKQPHCRLIINDFSGLFKGMGRFKETVCRTTLVDVSGTDWQPPEKKLQSQFRKAEREGIRIEPFMAERHFPRFISLMQQTEARHGRKPKYPPRFYRALADLAASDQRVQWVWCEQEGRPVASRIFFYEDDMLIQWQSFFDKTYAFLKPNQYIVVTMARQAAGRGIRYLNQGASPHDATGVRDYKARWGGVEHTYNSYQLDSGIGKLF